MKNKVLIDTSAWIVSFRKTGNERLKQRVISVLNSLSAATTNIVILELLQGCRDMKEYEDMKSRFEALDIVAIDERVWDIAYQTGFDLRKKGVTVPATDIIIASIVKAYGCSLLHHDRHFRHIAKHLSINAEDFIDE